jgi:hypothetical protein
MDEDEEFLMQELGDEGEDEQDMLGVMLAAVAMAEVNDSDDEEEIPKWGGSLPGKAPNKNRDFKGAHDRLVKQYFKGLQSTYTEVDFERRFRLPRPVFMRIYDKLHGLEPFVQKSDAFTKIAGITPLVRLVAAHRMLCYGEAADRQDENLEVSESVAHEAMIAYCKLVVQERVEDSRAASHHGIASIFPG